MDNYPFARLCHANRASARSSARVGERRALKESARPQPRSPSRRTIEQLEGRRLLAVALNNGSLTLTGGSGVDTYSVTRNGTNVSVVENGGAARFFPISSVNLINVSLGNGNDTINIANTLTIPASVNGGAGNDGIITGGGNDTLDGTTGDDYLDGRDGLDTVSYAALSSLQRLGAALTVTYFVQNGQTFPTTFGTGGVLDTGETDSYSSVETITGGAGDDVITWRADFGDAASGAYPPITTRANGGGGNDELTLYSFSGGDDVSIFPRNIGDGGDGNDTILIPGDGFATLIGGAGADSLEGSGRSPLILDPGTGIDTFTFEGTEGGTFIMPGGLENLVLGIWGGTIVGNDLDNVITADTRTPVNIDARGGNDRVEIIESFSFPVSATLLGGEGRDTLIGSRGTNVIDGGGEADYVQGNREDDTLTGGTGDDTLDGGFGNDTLDGGAGNDIVTYESRTEPIAGRLSVRAEYVAYPSIRLILGGRGGGLGEGDTYANIETLNGGAGSDILSFDVGFFQGRYFELPPLRVNGMGGDDNLNVSGASRNEAEVGNETIEPVSLIGDGGDGNDSFVHADSSRLNTTLMGGSGNDTFEHYSDDDSATIIPGSGFDAYDMRGGGYRGYTMPPGLEKLTIDNAADPVIGNDDDNIIIVSSPRDAVDGRGGNDRIEIYNAYGAPVTGGAGDDTIAASGSRNLINGDPGNDVLIVEGGHVDFVGGTGEDEIYLMGGDDSSPSVTLTKAETLRKLSISNGGTVSVAPSANEANTLRVRDLEVTGGGTLDLANNPMILDYSSATSPLAAVESLLRAGYASGTWSGTGIRSSTAASVAGTTLGVAESSAAFLNFPATFNGQVVDSTSVLIRYTRTGDVNLDRQVSFADLVILAQNYNQLGRSYSAGNLDYSADGSVNFGDLVALAQNYNAAMPASLSSGTAKHMLARPLRPSSRG